MKFEFLKKRKFWWWFISITILLPVVLISILFAYLYANQDEIVQDQITVMNEQHQGFISIGNTHLSPFENFPYISIKVDDVHLYENKADDAPVILDVKDIYIGFNIWDIVKGNFDIQKLLIEEGFFNIVLHEDGSNNLQNALATNQEVEDGDPFNIHLKKIELRNLDIHKLDEVTHTDVETFIYWGNGGFNTSDGFIAAHIDTEFELNIVKEGDTTYIHHKHFEVHTDLAHEEKSGILTIKPSGLRMENGDFDLEGSIDIKNDMDLNLSVKGAKSNFDMLIAFAPSDLIPVLERYNNAGNIYFNAEVHGPTLHGQLPFVDVHFGASEAFLENTDKLKRIDNLGFKGHFTTGKERNLQSMEFALTDMTAKLEKGVFVGSVLVNNFEEPEVNMDLFIDFNLKFLGGFLNITDMENASGDVSLEMKFHDIIDIDQPERTLQDFNRAYFSELKVNDLSLYSKDIPFPLKNLNAHVIMNGKQASLNQFDLLIGDSDLSMTGYLSDLPAIIHHTDIPVVAHLDINSNRLNIAEITGYSEKDSVGFDEQIEDLTVGLSFKSSAKAIIESENLPIGEFFIDSLHAQLKHYPHELHDFHVDFLIDESDLKIVDFTGFVDDSDFHFNGFVHDYKFWFQKELQGDVDLDLTLSSDLLRLEDIFTYQGQNFVPEDYRHEECDNLVLHVNTSMHYKDSGLHSIDVDLDQLQAKMHLHPLKFEDFKGRFHYEDDHVVVENFYGKIGKTILNVDLNYYLGEDESIRKRDNSLTLESSFIDFDALTNFNASPPTSQTPESEIKPVKTEDVAAHAEVFNLYELPFTDMDFNIDIDHFIYHRLDLRNIKAVMLTTKDHYIYIDDFKMDAAGGSIDLNGYFNGSDPKHIYVKPNLKLTGLDLDKLFFKFENFGQDEIVSDYVHGQINADITGDIRVYPDLVPDLDQSEIHMDVQVLNGKLENYSPVMMLSDYFGDKDLTSIQFDTLQNHMDITKGQITIPNMTIESTLGHMDISGTQDMNENIDYFVRIPLSLIKEAAKNKLFGVKEADEEMEDEIIEVDPDKKTRYLNLNISGTFEEYSIKMKKDRKK